MDALILNFVILRDRLASDKVNNLVLALISTVPAIFQEILGSLTTKLFRNSQVRGDYVPFRRYMNQ